MFRQFFRLGCLGVHLSKRLLCTSISPPPPPLPPSETPPRKTFEAIGAFNKESSAHHYTVDFNKEVATQRDLMDALLRPQTVIVLHGPHSSAKTSRALAAKAKLEDMHDKKWKVVYMPRVCNGDEVKNLDKFWKSFVLKFTDEANVCGLALPKSVDMQDHGSLRHWFQRVFTESTEQIVLMIDEFDGILGEDPETANTRTDFLQTLHEIKHSTNTRMQSCLLIGTFAVTDVATIGNTPPFNSSSCFRVGSFTKDQCNDLLKQMEDDRGIKVDTDVKEHLYELSNGHAGAFCFLGSLIQDDPELTCLAGWKTHAIHKRYWETSSVQRILREVRQPTRDGALLWNTWDEIERKSRLEGMPLKVEVADHSDINLGCRRLAALGALVREDKNGNTTYRPVSDMMFNALHLSLAKPTQSPAANLDLKIFKAPLAELGKELVEKCWDSQYFSGLINWSNLRNRYIPEIKKPDYPERYYKRFNALKEQIHREPMDAALMKLMAAGKITFMTEVPCSDNVKHKINAVVKVEEDGKEERAIAIQYCAHIKPSRVREHAAKLLTFCHERDITEALLIAVSMDKNMDPSSITAALGQKDIEKEMLEFIESFAAKGRESIEVKDKNNNKSSNGNQVPEKKKKKVELVVVHAVHGISGPGEIKDLDCSVHVQKLI